METKRIKLITFLLIAIFALSGCDKKKLTITLNTPQQEDKALSIPPVDMYIDCSGSMKGYVDLRAFVTDEPMPDLNFTRVVPDICNKIIQTGGSDALKIFRLTDRREYEENDVRAFFQRLTNGGAFGGRTTELDEMLISVINKTKDKESAAIIVTDAILSYGPQFVNSKNRDYNLIHKPLLGAKVQNALGLTPSLSIAIVKYSSHFNGQYYFNCKEEIQFPRSLLKNRPFYLFIIGKPEYIKAILSKDGLLPRSEGVFTVSAPIELQCGLFRKKTEKESVNTVLNINKDGAGYVELNDDKDRAFIVGIKASSIPPFYVDNKDEFFKQLHCDDRQVKTEKISRDRLADKGQKLLEQDYDYFYLITLRKEMIQKGLNKKLVFYFPPGLDIQQSTTDKDFDLNDVSEIEGRTWGLDMITNAIEKVSYPDKAMGAKFEITLQVPSKNISTTNNKNISTKKQKQK
jgi:hypothetical protein